MTAAINAGEFTLTVGIDHGSEYLFVTHRATGKQWMSKSNIERDYDYSGIAKNIELGITKFYPDLPFASCDSRFWMEVKERRNENGFTI